MHLRKRVYMMIISTALVAALFALSIVSLVSAAGGTVEVDLSDFTNLPAVSWAVTVDQDTLEAGTVIFNVENINNGPPDIPHDFFVVRSDLAPDNLPRLGPELGVDEAQVDIVGSLPLLFPGESAELTVDLTEGSYVLFCNVNAEGGERAAHYQDGMFTGFTVTAPPPEPEPQPRTPSVGESVIPKIASASLIASLALIATGVLVLFVRKRLGAS